MSKKINVRFEFDGLQVEAKGTLCHNYSEVNKLWLRFSNVEQRGMPEPDAIDIIEDIAKEKILEHFFCPSLDFRE